MASRPPVSPARRAAFTVLVRVFEDDAYADRVFATAAAGLDPRDRALAQRLAYGAVQRVRTGRGTEDPEEDKAESAPASRRSRSCYFVHCLAPFPVGRYEHLGGRFIPQDQMRQGEFH